MRDSADADEESHEREDGDRNETARPEGARHTQKQVLEQAIFQNGCKYLRYKQEERKQEIERIRFLQKSLMVMRGNIEQN